MIPQQTPRPRRPVLDLSATPATNFVRPAGKPERGLFAGSGAANGKFKGRQKNIPGKMNGTEESYAARLDEELAAGQIVWWKFESLKLRLADSSFLTVDFLVMRADLTLELHEVKGSGPKDDESETKLKVAAEIYPFIFIRAEKRRKKDGGGWVTRLIG